MVRGSLGVQRLAGKSCELLLQWRRPCVPWRHGSTPCTCMCCVLCGGSGARRPRWLRRGGRAALARAAAGRLRRHSLARTSTCGPPRQRPGPSPGGPGLPIGPPRRRLQVAHGLGLCCCFRSPGRRLAARLACASARRSVACALALALMRLSMSAGLCVYWYDRNGRSPALPPGQGRACTVLGPRLGDPCTEQPLR